MGEEAKKLINYFLHRPIIEGTLCTLKELQDGTYSLIDVLLFHEILDLRKKISEVDTTCQV